MISKKPLHFAEVFSRLDPQQLLRDTHRPASIYSTSYIHLASYALTRFFTEEGDVGVRFDPETEAVIDADPGIQRLSRKIENASTPLHERISINQKRILRFELFFGRLVQVHQINKDYLQASSASFDAAETLPDTRQETLLAAV